MSKLRVPSPRLLPLTIAALAVLLALKAATALIVLVPGLQPGALAPLVAPALASAAHGEAKNEGARRPDPPNGADGKPSAPAAASPPAPQEQAVSEAERALLLDLRQRRQVLDAREAALGVREQVLGAAEKRLSDRVSELQSLQTRLEELEAARKTRDEANWRGLVKLYETMKPRDAAAIMNDLDQPVLLEVLDRMKEAKAAAILAAMQPDKARQATADLAHLRTHANTPAGG